MAEENTTQTQEEKQEEKAEVPEKFRTLVGSIEKLSVLELAELVKVLEEKFGVSAAAPVMAPAAPAGSGAGAEAAEEKTSFTVELTAVGDNKIGAIKAVREITGLALKDAKGLVDGAPKPVKEGVSKQEAEEIKKKLESAGAKAAIK